MTARIKSATPHRAGCTIQPQTNKKHVVLSIKTFFESNSIVIY